MTRIVRDNLKGFADDIRPPLEPGSRSLTQEVEDWSIAGASIPAAEILKLPTALLYDLNPEPMGERWDVLRALGDRKPHWQHDCDYLSFYDRREPSVFSGFYSTSGQGSLLVPLTKTNGLHYHNAFHATKLVDSLTNRLGEPIIMNWYTRSIGLMAYAYVIEGASVEDSGLLPAVQYKWASKFLAYATHYCIPGIEQTHLRMKSAFK